MKTLQRMFETHPSPASDAGDEAFALVTAASECVALCTTCADACLSEDDPSGMRDCIRLNLDCADICGTTARLFTRPGKQDAATLRAQLDACAKACTACAEECQDHADSMEHCRICAEVCRACADACEGMKGKLVS